MTLGTLIFLAAFVAFLIYIDWSIRRGESQAWEKAHEEDFGSVWPQECTPMDETKVAALCWEFGDVEVRQDETRSGWTVGIGDDVARITADEAVLPLRMLIPIIQERLTNSTANRRHGELTEEPND